MSFPVVKFSMFKENTIFSSCFSMTDIFICGNRKGHSYRSMMVDTEDGNLGHRRDTEGCTHTGPSHSGPLPSLEQLLLCLLWKLGCLNIPEAGPDLASSLVWALHPTTFTPRSQFVVSMSYSSRSPSLLLSPPFAHALSAQACIATVPCDCCLDQGLRVGDADSRPPSFPLVFPGERLISSSPT